MWKVVPYDFLSNFLWVFAFNTSIYDEVYFSAFGNIDTKARKLCI